MIRVLVFSITLTLVCHEAIGQVKPADLVHQRATKSLLREKSPAPVAAAGKQERLPTPKQLAARNGIVRDLLRRGYSWDAAAARADMAVGLTDPKLGGMPLSQAVRMRPEDVAKFQEALLAEQLRARAPEAQLSLPGMPIRAPQLTQEDKTGVLFDDDFLGYRIKLGNGTFGFRDNGFSYSYMRAGNIELYNDSSGTTGSRRYSGTGRYDTYSNPRTGYSNSGYYPYENQHTGRSTGASLSPSPR
jgi:hypothetical protein